MGRPATPTSSAEPLAGRGAARAAAWAYGIVCHLLFALAIAAMVVGLYSGLASGLGRLDGVAAWVSNILLALQFPLLHSTLLSRRGRPWLAYWMPRALRPHLSTTVFATIASASLALVFFAWSPTPHVLWTPGREARYLLTVLYAGAWIFVARAIWDAGPALQTGYLGWSSVAAGRPVGRQPMPTGGLFRHSRQPIYLGFTLVLWTAPGWTADRLLLAGVWTLYCLLAPRWKEVRFARLYGAEFERYRSRVPYWIPRLRFPGPEHGARSHD